MWLNVWFGGNRKQEEVKRTYVIVDEPIWVLQVLLCYDRLAEETNITNTPTHKWCNQAFGWVQNESFPYHAVVYLGNSLEFRLFCNSWISSRASSTLWVCLDFLFLPLLFLPASDVSCKLSHESQRHASDQALHFIFEKNPKEKNIPLIKDKIHTVF